MVELEMRGQIGNNLLQYALARIISQELGYALRVIDSTYKSNSHIENLKKLMDQFEDAPLELPGLEFDSPADYSYNISKKSFDGYTVDLDAIIGNKTNRKICLSGSFERYEIFQPYKEQIRKWFNIPAHDLGHDIGENDVVLHVRWGDFVLEGRAITMNFYTDVLNKMEYDKLYVCGYALGSEVKEALEPFSPIYISGDPISDFKFIKGFNRMILSPSTFSWWTAFLSDAKEIIAPVPEANLKKTIKLPIDLRVFDEDRYRYVENVPLIQRDITLEDIKRSWKMLPLERRIKWINQWSNSQLRKTSVGRLILKLKNKLARFVYSLVRS